MSKEEFADLAEKYMDTIYRVAYSWTKNTHDANDITQDVLIQLFKTTKEFESDSHLRNWLIRVTVNQCKMLFRSPWNKVNDTEINLQHAIYKMVPSDYELTDEDKVNQEKPNYEISYGTEKVEEQNYDGFTFVKNGKRYSMFAWDCDMTDNDWYEMAEELLN